MGPLSFINPLLLLGLLGIAVPILIHFFFRRRAKILRFSAMRFVLLSHKKVARRLLIREYLLLLIRCLIIAALALALARPLFSRVIKGLSLGEEPAALALILDNSYSMDLRKGEGTLFKKAKQLALKMVDSMDELDEAALLFTSGVDEVPLTSDRRALREAIQDAEISYTQPSPMDAVRRAGVQLNGASQSVRAIVVFTDLQRNGWQSSADLPANLPPVYLMDLTEGVQYPNLAVGGLSLDPSAIQRRETLNIKARLHNFSETQAGQVLVRLNLGEQILAQGFLNIPAKGSEVKEFLIEPEGLKLEPGTIEIVGNDDLGLDDKAYFHLAGGGQVRALVVDGEPGTLLIEMETFFVEKALNPRLYAHSRVNPTTIGPGELDDYELSDFDVLMLCNVEKISEEKHKAIRDFVDNGGGLFISLGERVDADLYNKTLGQILPRELRGKKSPYAGAMSQQDIRVMHIDSILSRGDAGQIHPVLSVFETPDEGDLGLAEFRTYMLLQQETVPQSRVILRLTDGTPLMVEKEFGKGKVILFTSTVDREWNDLCIRPTFLPLIQQTVQYLGGALLVSDPGGLAVGLPIASTCPSDRAGAVIKDPRGNLTWIKAGVERGLRQVRYNNTASPGLYLLKFVENEPKGSPDVFAWLEADKVYAVNLDLAESDLEQLSEGEVSSLFSVTQAYIIAPSGHLDRSAEVKTKTTPWTKYVFWLLALLVIAELSLIRKG